MTRKHHFTLFTIIFILLMVAMLFAGYYRNNDAADVDSKPRSGCCGGNPGE